MEYHNKKLIMPYGIRKLMSKQMVKDIEGIIHSRVDNWQNIELKLQKLGGKVQLVYDGHPIRTYDANEDLSELMSNDEYIIFYIINKTFFIGITMRVVSVNE